LKEVEIMQNYKQPAVLDTPSYGGVNTAMQFSLIPRSQSPRSQNTFMDEVGDISKRPGTIPLTTSALAAAIQFLTLYKSAPSLSSTDEIYAASGTTLYKFNGTTALTALTMTAALDNADIHTVGFTNAALTSRLIIGDNKALKQCDGSAVTLITPAADDPLPAFPNVMTSVNTKGNKFVWEYSGHVFVSPGTAEMYYTKRFEFDYIPSDQYFLLPRDNDFINGDGVAFDAVCLIPMRRNWAILTGETVDNFKAESFLNTEYGVIAPRSIDKVTYPDGSQTVFFLSDNEMQEIFTAIIDGGGRQYATRSIMQNKINFTALGLTDAEKAAAVGKYHPELFVYLLSFKKSGVDYTYAYDVRNREWYTDWLTFNAKAYVSLNGTLYFAGSTGHLHKFDKDLYTDWNESTKTTGTAVYYKRYTPALSFEFSGFQSFWDSYLLESKQWRIPSTLDITFIFADVTDVFPGIIANEVFVEGRSRWGRAKYANVNFTDLVNNPNEIIFDYSRLSKYMQVLVENNRDEPVKIFKEKFKGRVSGK
jgi:hypothetical protein